VLTNNGRDFRKLAGVAVVDYLGSGVSDTSSSNVSTVRGASNVVPKTLDFDPIKSWRLLANTYAKVFAEAGCGLNGRNPENDIEYLRKAFETIERLWRRQFKKMERVRALVLSEAPLFGTEKETYFYNPKAEPTSFFQFNDAGAVAGKEFAAGRKLESAKDRKQCLIDTLTAHGVLILDLFPYALNPIHTAVNYRTLRRDLYVKLFRESADIWLRPKLDAIRRKAEKPKFLFRYKRVQERLGRELREIGLLRQDDEVAAIYGKNMPLDRNRLAEILGVRE
jgi:hypothetical protein